MKHIKIYLNEAKQNFLIKGHTKQQNRNLDLDYIIDFYIHEQMSPMTFHIKSGKEYDEVQHILDLKRPILKKVLSGTGMRFNFETTCLGKPKHTWMEFYQLLMTNRNKPIEILSNGFSNGVEEYKIQFRLEGAGKEIFYLYTKNQIK